jgi:hypothetical protein
MKAAANVIAAVAWISFLGALWWPLVAGEMPPVGAWFAATAFSLLVGLVVPGFLLNLEDRLRPVARGKREEIRMTTRGKREE